MAATLGLNWLYNQPNVTTTTDSNLLNYPSGAQVARYGNANATFHIIWLAPTGSYSTIATDFVNSPNGSILYDITNKYIYMKSVGSGFNATDGTWVKTAQLS